MIVISRAAVRTSRCRKLINAVAQIPDSVQRDGELANLITVPLAQLAQGRRTEAGW